MSEKIKSIIVYSSGKCEWESCQAIKDNLISIYAQDKNNILFDISSEKINEQGFSVKYLHDWCSDLWKNKPERITFIDFSPSPAKLIALIISHAPKLALNVEFVFHIYGNFLKEISNWIAVEALLVGHNIKFLCASPRHLDLLVNIAPKCRKMTFLCPFPLNTKVFHFDLKLRERTRKNLGIHKDEKLVVYIGRLSLQKNISLLFKLFKTLCNDKKLKTKLLIVGSFDDIGASMIGLPQLHSWYFQNTLKILSALDSDIKDKVSLMGPVTPKEVNAILNAADLFWSLSTYHYEDFGMAPAEALCTGLPCVLTDWGGYSGFKDTKIPSAFVEVSMTEQSDYLIKLKNFIDDSTKFLVKNTTQMRKSNSCYFAKSYSISSVRNYLTPLLLKKNFRFNGFGIDKKKMIDEKESFISPISREILTDNFGPYYKKNRYE